MRDGVDHAADGRGVFQLAGTAGQRPDLGVGALGGQVWGLVPATLKVPLLLVKNLNWQPDLVLRY